MTADRDATMALLVRFGKAFNAGNADGILACVTADFEWHLAQGPDAPDGRTCAAKRLFGKLSLNARLQSAAFASPKTR